MVMPSDFLWIAAFMTLILVLAALAPMWKVWRVRIVEALGHV